MNLLVAAAALKIAVLGLEATGVEPELAKNLSEVLTTVVDEVNGGGVIGRSDIQAILGFEQQRQLLACASDSCLAELGGALGVDKLVTGSVGRVEDTWILTLKLIDQRKGVVERRLSDTVEGKAAPLLAAIRARVPQLLAGLGAAPPAAKAPAEAAQPEARPAAAAAEAKRPATPLPQGATAPPPAKGPGLRIAGWSLLGGAVLGAAVGALFAAQGAAAADRYRRALAPGDIGAEHAAAASAYTRANVVFAIAGGLGAAGGVCLALSF